MLFSRLNKTHELLKEKYTRHEKILIQAYKSIKQKETELKEVNGQLQASEEELKQMNEELHTSNETLFEKNEIIRSQNMELSKALQNLKETQSQLVQAEKMASLGVLTAGIAHEINNPLNFIMCGFEGLTNYFEDLKKEPDEKVKTLLDAIYTGVNRVEKIVQGLNHFSRDNEDFNEVCDPHTIIDSCLLILNNQLRNRVTVLKDYTHKPYKLNGNVGKLHQLFLNILSNASQSICSKGKVFISTQIRKHNFLIEIEDSGCGISPENLPKVMDPFFTTKGPGEGTGLGLSLSYLIIKDHNGKIHIQSEINKGTLVRVTLPIIS